MKRVQVEIMERGYVLACPEGAEAYFEEAVRRVDSAMRAIRDAGKIKARDRIAVLAALNLAFENASAESASAPSASAATTAAEEDEELHRLLQSLDAALDSD